jgi:hypothetical protein
VEDAPARLAGACCQAWQATGETRDICGGIADQAPSFVQQSSARSGRS